MLPTPSSPSRGMCVLKTAVFSLLAAVVLLGPAVPASAQDQPKAKFDLDLARLLYEDNARSMRDPVWKITARSGTKLVFVPFSAATIEEQTKVSRPPFSVRGGRFIGYVIPGQQALTQQKNTGPSLSAFLNADPQAHKQLLFGDEEEKTDADDGPASGETDPAAVPGDDDKADPDGKAGGDKTKADDSAKPKDDGKPGPAPASAPRLTREIIFYPDGTISWEVDRVFPSATLNNASETNVYPYKIDPRLFKKIVPEKPKREARKANESSRDYRERQKEKALEYREKYKAYRELRSAVNDLPEVFREPAPTVVYAVFEWAVRDEMKLEGPAPLPWEMSIKATQKMAELAQGQLKLDTDQGKADLKAIAKVLDSKHAVAERAVALAVMRSGIVASVQEDGEGFNLVARLLDSKDKGARCVAQYAVTHTTNPSRASARLLESAGRAGQGYERDMLRFAALRMFFSLEAGNPESTGLLSAKVNEAAVDAKGPGAKFVLASLFAAQDKANAFADAKTARQIIDGMAKKIDLTRVPQAQAEGAIQALVKYAVTNPVARELLDKKLLRSKNKAIVQSTLTQLAEQADAITKQRAKDKAQNKPADPADPYHRNSAQPKVTTIAIHAMDHGLIALLKGDDKQLQPLAWKALARFHVAKDPYQEEEVIGQASPQMILNDVLALAKKQAKTPPSLVPFLIDQPEERIGDVARRQLLELMMDAETKGDTAFVTRGVQEVIGSEGRFNNLIERMVGKDKLRLVRLLYRTTTNQPPPMVSGLVAEQSGRISRWFLGELKLGKLPAADKWATVAADARAGGEKALIGMAASDDADVAMAGSSALVINAGGSVDDQKQFMRDVAKLDKRDRDTVGEAWAKLKKKLHARALAKAKGTYQLYATIGKASEQPGAKKTTRPAPGTEGEAPKPPAKPDNPEGVIGKRVNLGLVELQAKDATVSLSVQAIKLSMTPNRLGIRLNQVASIKTFGKPEFAGLDGQALSEQFIDLLPQDNGVWAGKVELQGGIVIGVALVPTQNK